MGITERRQLNFTTDFFVFCDGRFERFRVPRDKNILLFIFYCAGGADVARPKKTIYAGRRDTDRSPLTATQSLRSRPSEKPLACFGSFDVFFRLQKVFFTNDTSQINPRRLCRRHGRALSKHDSVSIHVTTVLRRVKAEELCRANKKKILKKLHSRRISAQSEHFCR